MTQERSALLSQVELKQIAARFESEWKSGSRPQLMEFIGRASEPSRHSLLLELIGIDVDYRQRAGENPSFDEYRSTFPELNAAEVEMLATRSMNRTAPTLDLAEHSESNSPSVPAPARASERFKKIAEIGRGGMGSVWRAIQLSTGREVALKELPASALTSAHARLRFEDEIHWASQLQHPHIARVYDSGLLEGMYFYAMELIQGEHLDSYAYNHHWTLRQMLEMMRLIAKAIHYAHERNILHRDLKPSNILITADGKPIIVDFGLACLLRETSGDAKPHYGDISGTPAYMAPEQASGRADLIHRATDVYSLGVILYQFVTGVLPRPPKPGPDSRRPETAQRKIPPARELKPRISKDLDALIMKCLAPNPVDRYADAQQLAADIDRLLEGEELNSRPLNWIGRIRSWCCRPARLIQVGNLSITTGAILAPFHILAIFLGLARLLGVSIPSFDNLRLRDFILLMASFLIFDMWLLLSGVMMRRNRIGAVWLNLIIVLAWFSWFILVLSGVVVFDTGGAVSSMAARFPLYIIFLAFALVGLGALCCAIAAHYAQAFLDLNLPTKPAAPRVH